MTPLTAAHRTWRARVFAATYLSYVGFYFCRKPFSAAKHALQAETQWSQPTLGNIGAAYLFTYAVGQFLASAMGTRLGPRKNVLLGMAITLAATLAMGVTLDAWQWAALIAVNGLAQATGWSGNVGTMAGWFHKHERGRVMGAWATNFNIGSLVSGWAMAAVLGVLDWRWCFYTGAAVMAVVWVQFYLFQRNRPEDVGLEPVDDPVTVEIDEAKVPDPPPTGFLGLDRTQWANLMIVAGFYFFAKFIRYAIWSWAPYFLSSHYHLSESTANWYATAFDVLGLPSVFLCGYMSDRFFGSRRATIAMIFMAGAALSALMLWQLYDVGVAMFVVLLAVLGLTAYGPDALLTGAGAMDIGGRRNATFAAAVISGFGSTGSVVQEVVIARVYDPKTGDLDVVFAMLLVSAAMATLFCAALVIRNRRGKGV